MFEKEAEEYVKAFTDRSHIWSNDKIMQLQLREAYKDGAEFGYNKANEWHKPSEKLPERCSLVLAYAFDDTEPSLYQFVTNDQWEWMPRRIAFLSNDQIRLWKEIVLPKEIKEK